MGLSEALLPEAWDCDAADWWPGGQPLTEGWDGAVLRVVLPVPPTDNHCHSSSGTVRFPTREYKQFLSEASPHLHEVLGEVVPDTEHWWWVWVRVWLGTSTHRPDAQNLLKPCLDLLSGARLGVKGERNSRGTSLAGRVVKAGALWNDDDRIELRECRLMALDAFEPRVELVAALGAAAPIREREAAARAQKEWLREEALATQRREDLAILRALRSVGATDTLKRSYLEYAMGCCAVAESRVRAAWKRREVEA